MAQEDENERGRGANARMRFRQSAGQERENVRKASRSMRLLIAVDAVLFLAILIAGGMLLYRRQNREAEQHLSEIQAPDWYTQDFLTVNPYSRPGTKREHVRDIVIHYVANPGTSAIQNRNYFEGLKDQSGSKTVSDGRFTDATIKSLARLTGWLCKELSLNEKHIIRHHDVSGKNCPKYYVEHEDAWRTLKKKLAAGIKEAKAE